MTIKVLESNGEESKMTQTPNVSVMAVIPAFNEEKTIGKVVREARKYVVEVVVVDDGSSDKTIENAVSAGATVLRHPHNLGYGSALATGFAHVKNNGAGVLVVLDGDGQHDPAEIPRLVKPIIDGSADIVSGSRFIDENAQQHIPAYRKFGIGVVNNAWKLAAGDNMTDTQCGFRAYSRDAVEKIEINEVNMSASLEILDEASQNNLRVMEIPVSVKYGGDTSTMKPGKHGMELVNYVLKKMREEHPLLIFGGGGALMSVIGIAFGVYSMNSYFDSRYLPFGPTILAALFIYIGTLMIFGGLILNSIQTLASRLEDRVLK
jgi:glycosyltransferase involved in cell wall biosynthesis